MAHLTDDQESALRSSVMNSQEHLYSRLLPAREWINRVYAGRQVGTGPPRGTTWWGSVLGQGRYHPAKSFVNSTANLLYSTKQTLVAALFPATPSVEVEGLTEGAYHLENDQRRLNDFMLLNSGLEDAMRLAIQFDIDNGWAGLEATEKTSGPAHERVQIQAVDALACGWEPFLRRYRWRTEFRAYTDLPSEAWHPDPNIKPKPGDQVIVTSVYLDGWDGLKGTATFVRHLEGGQQPEEDSHAQFSQGELGRHVEFKPGETPILEFLSTTDPPSGEDVPPSEVLQWMPSLKSIAVTLNSIDRETSAVNRVYVYLKGDIDWQATKDVIKTKTIGGQQLTFLQLNGTSSASAVQQDIAGDNANGRVRPLEREQVMQELQAILGVQLQMFEEVTGIGELQRGSVPRGRQTATEISVAQNNAQLRNARRREAIGDAVARLVQRISERQRGIYGRQIMVRTEAGQALRIPVPDPKVSRFLFRVDAVELGHLVARGDLNVLSNALQTVTQVRNLYPSPQSMPPDVKHLLRKTLRAHGIRDADSMYPPTLVGADPFTKFVQLMLGDVVSIRPEPGENPDEFIAFYRSMASGYGHMLGPSQQIALDNAIQAYIEEDARQRAQRQSVQPEVAGTALNGAANPSPLAQALLAGGVGPTQLPA